MEKSIAREPGADAGPRKRYGIGAQIVGYHFPGTKVRRRIPAKQVIVTEGVVRFYAMQELIAWLPERSKFLDFLGRKAIAAAGKTCIIPLANLLRLVACQLENSG